MFTIKTCDAFKLKYLFCFRVFANMFLLLYQLGSCCIYFVFVASNIKAVSMLLYVPYCEY